MSDEKKTSDTNYWTMAPPDAPSLVSRVCPLGAAAQQQLLRHSALPPSFLSLATFAEFEQSSPLYEMIADYVAKSVTDTSKSFTLGKKSCEDADACSSSRTTLDLGLGVFDLTFANESLYVVHETLDGVVATNCEGATFWRHLVVVAPNGIAPIRELCEVLIAKAEKVVPNTIKLYRWHIKHSYWKRQAMIAGRSMDSVVLPKETKDKCVGDLEEFLSDSTKEFYTSHGIPFRRAYLFHGAPGAGKTSFIQAIATKWNRNICFMQPTHPDMTDEDLQSGFTYAPKNSIIVLEDIDSLFTAGRENKNSKSSLTFSGLLNALDGVSSSSGQIVILSTNFREQLDAALIRNGRVDVQIEFTTVTREQCEGMFNAYYAGKEDEAKKFGDVIMQMLERLGEKVSSCALQHFFVQCRKMSSSECLANFKLVEEEIESRKKEGGAKEKKKEEDDDNDDDDEEEEGRRGGRKEKGEQGWSGEGLMKMSLLTTNLALVAATAIVLCKAVEGMKR